MSSAASAGGGFPFDPTHCPKRGWVPNEEVSPIATPAVCNFVAALDRGDYATAYALTGPEFKYFNSLERFIEYSNRMRLQTGQVIGEPPERVITEESLVIQDPVPVFRFTLQVLYPNMSLRVDLYVREERGISQISGFQIGPY